VHPAALVLVGTERVLADCRRASGNLQRLAGCVRRRDPGRMAGDAGRATRRSWTSRTSSTTASTNSAVLRRGGRVAVTEDGALAPHDRVALTLRR